MDHEYEAGPSHPADDEGQSTSSRLLTSWKMMTAIFCPGPHAQQEPDEIASDAETYYIF